MPEIIAEIGQNHNGDIALAKRLIAEAKAAGASVAKFQVYDARALFPKEGNEWYDYNCKTELSRADVDEGRKEFQNILFSKIVPNCKKLGLLDRNKGWLRGKFTELGVIQFEDWVDTGEEYAMLDEVSKDRESASAA